MAGKPLELPACPELIDDLSRILQQYAEAAYPVGGSECGQVAREALQNVVGALQDSLHRDEPATISRRLRATVRAAVNYELEVAAANQTCFSARAVLFEAILAGEPVGAGQYVDAYHVDRHPVL